jgi:3-oxoacid CoA-transferase subunit B
VTRGWSREQIAARAAGDLRDGECVNLGIGLPTLVTDHLPAGLDVVVHTENGVLGAGPAPAPGAGDPQLIDAGTQPITVLAGASFVSSSTSFAIIRGGYVDTTLLGAMEVSAGGDLANWAVPGRLVRGIGGAMDLVTGAGRVIVLTEHVGRDGSPKLVEKCSLPLTGRACVDRVITNLAVLDLTPAGFRLVELAPGVEVQEVLDQTAAPVEVDAGLRARRSPRGRAARAPREEGVLDASASGS